MRVRVHVPHPDWPHYAPIERDGPGPHPPDTPFGKIGGTAAALLGIDGMNATVADVEILHGNHAPNAERTPLFQTREPNTNWIEILSEMPKGFSILALAPEDVGVSKEMAEGIVKDFLDIHEEALAIFANAAQVKIGKDGYDRAPALTLHVTGPMEHKTRPGVTLDGKPHDGMPHVTVSTYVYPWGLDQSTGEWHHLDDRENYYRLQSTVTAFAKQEFAYRQQFRGIEIAWDSRGMPQPKCVPPELIRLASPASQQIRQKVDQFNNGQAAAPPAPGQPVATTPQHAQPQPAATPPNGAALGAPQPSGSPQQQHAQPQHTSGSPQQQQQHAQPQHTSTTQPSGSAARANAKTAGQQQSGPAQPNAAQSQAKTAQQAPSQPGATGNQGPAGPTKNQNQGPTPAQPATRKTQQQAARRKMRAKARQQTRAKARKNTQTKAQRQQNARVAKYYRAAKTRYVQSQMHITIRELCHNVGFVFMAAFLAPVKFANRQQESVRSGWMTGDALKALAAQGRPFSAADVQAVIYEKHVGAMLISGQAADKQFRLWHADPARRGWTAVKPPPGQPPNQEYFAPKSLLEAQNKTARDLSTLTNRTNAHGIKTQNTEVFLQLNSQHFNLNAVTQDAVRRVTRTGGYFTVDTTGFGADAKIADQALLSVTAATARAYREEGYGVVSVAATQARAMALLGDRPRGAQAVDIDAFTDRYGARTRIGRAAHDTLVSGFWQDLKRHGLAINPHRAAGYAELAYKNAKLEKGTILIVDRTGLTAYELSAAASAVTRAKGKLICVGEEIPKLEVAARLSLLQQAKQPGVSPQQSQGQPQQQSPSPQGPSLSP